jgi:hypothetical protein
MMKAQHPPRWIKSACGRAKFTALASCEGPSASNLFTGFGNLSISNGATRTDTLAEFSDAGMLAPYATVAQTGETFFSFKGANSDGMNHFRMLGSGVIGLEDEAGGFDQDFDDNVLSFNFKLK